MLLQAAYAGFGDGTAFEAEFFQLCQAAKVNEAAAAGAKVVMTAPAALRMVGGAALFGAGIGAIAGALTMQRHFQGAEFEPVR